MSKANAEAITAWVAQEEDRGVATWQPTSSAPLVWAHDGNPYSPTGLVKRIGSLSGVEIGVVAGPRSWRDPSGKTLPEIADTAENDG